MLDQVREPWRGSRVKKIVAYVLFGLICITFVFVGVNPETTGVSGSGTAATVNDVIISSFDLQREVQRLETQYGDALKGLPAAQRQMTSMRLRANALNELVEYEVTYQVAEDAGLFPTTAATRDYIVTYPAFQQDGQFQRDQYKGVLAQNNLTVATFEERVRKSLVVGQARNLFITALQEPQALERLTREARETKVNLQFVKISGEAFQASDAVTPAATTAFLAKPENKSKVKAYYESHKEEFSSQAEVRARHILIKGDSPEAAKKIADIRKEAEKGDFAELAKKYSEDEGSKAKGGDLDYFSKGRMVPEFENVAFSLPVGKTSEPVKSSFGYHIIKVEDRREAKVQTLESVEPTIARRLVGEEVRDQELKALEATLQAKQDPNAWVTRHKLKWDETGDVSLDQSYVPKIEGSSEALEAALSLRQPGETYPRLVRAGPDAYIVRLKKLTVPNLTTDGPPAGGRFASGGVETMSLWTEGGKKTSRIRLNEALLSQ